MQRLVRPLLFACAVALLATTAASTTTTPDDRAHPAAAVSLSHTITDDAAEEHTVTHAAASHAAKCKGAKPCRACKTCEYCKHCNAGGGTCGVCR